MRLEMLQIARLAPRILSEGTELVRTFVRQRHNVDGGFADRNGESDLYYTVFGLGCMHALEEPVPKQRVAAWLAGYGDGAGLELVDLCALARCWAGIGGLSAEQVPRLLARIEQFRAPAGGYNGNADASLGNPYGNYLALGAFQDLNCSPKRPQELVQGCQASRSADGGYANAEGLPKGNTPAAAAVESVLRNLEARIPEEAGSWILAQAYQQGGFFATPGAPMPDMLSTATALHALAGMAIDFEAIKEPCLDFIDSLWVNQGAFFGSWGDSTLDCEYTYYALLALGHLSL